MEIVTINTVQDLMNYLHTLPKDMIVCGSDSGCDGIVVKANIDDNYIMFSDNWEV